MAASTDVNHHQVGIDVVQHLVQRTEPTPDLSRGGGPMEGRTRRLHVVVARDDVRRQLDVRSLSTDDDHLRHSERRQPAGMAQVPTAMVVGVVDAE